MQISGASDRYVRWLLAARDLSPHTIRAYRSDLSSFERYLGTAAAVDQIDQEALLAFIEAQKAAGLSPASLRRRASALHGFSRWLFAQGLVEADPWSGTSLSLGRSRRLPRTVPADQLDRLLKFLKLAALADGDRPTPQAVAERPHQSTTLLSVVLMIATGARVHEVVGIRCRDVDLPGRTVRLLGKGRRERQVFLTNEWITTLADAYIRARSTLGLRHQTLLFNLHLNPLSPPALRSRLAKAGSAAGLESRVTPHMLRHTAATQLIEAGVDIRYIQRLLGHASLSTTEIYTHVSDRALKRVVSDADVLGRFAQAR